MFVLYKFFYDIYVCLCVCIITSCSLLWRKLQARNGKNILGLDETFYAMHYFGDATIHPEIKRCFHLDLIGEMRQEKQAAIYLGPWIKLRIFKEGKISFVPLSFPLYLPWCSHQYNCIRRNFTSTALCIKLFLNPNTKWIIIYGR